MLCFNRSAVTELRRRLRGLVGDDDQNIYQFRGANVAYIRRFQEDYRAERHYLVENYRSTRHILNAAGALIAQNRDRMKQGHSVRVDDRRKASAPGGPWSRIDPLGAGRVQVISCTGETIQARSALNELLRLRRLDTDLDLEACAVLAREWHLLDPLRGMLEALRVPVSLSLPADRTPPLTRIREIARFLRELSSSDPALCRASGLIERLDGLFSDTADNPWVCQLRGMLEAWREETGDADTPWLDAFEGDFVLRRRAEPGEDADASNRDSPRSYALLGLQDMHLGYPARFSAGHPIHDALASLRPGSPLYPEARGRDVLLADGSRAVAKLSKTAAGFWRGRLDKIRSIRVVAVVRRSREDGGLAYRDAYRVDAWEVPLVELRLEAS